MTSLLIDELLGKATTDSIQPAEFNPLFDLIVPQSSPSALFAVKSEDKSTLANYFTIPQFRSQLPADLRYAKFAFGLPVVNKVNGIETVDVYALAGNRK